MNLKRVGLGTSKAVFTLHGVNHDEKAVLRRTMRRAEMEACGGSHHWGRKLGSFGHVAQLVPPHCVKPFVRRGKNGRNDAEAVSEAAARPGMPSVAVRPAEQQAEAVCFRRASCWCGSGRSWSMPCAATPPSSGSWRPRAPAGYRHCSKPWRPGRRAGDAAKKMLALLGGQVAQLAETRSVCGWDFGVGTPDETAAQGQPGQSAAGRGARHRPGRRAEPGAHR